MIIGFSGTRRGLTRPQRDALHSLLMEFEPDVVHHGCCVGADSDFSVLAGTRAGVKIHAHPADLGALTDKDALDWADVTYKPLPPLERNQVIVDESELLIACPAEATEQLRSGTWATVRFARKCGKRVVIIYPDGSLIREGPDDANGIG